MSASRIDIGTQSPSNRHRNVILFQDSAETLHRLSVRRIVTGALYLIQRNQIHVGLPALQPTRQFQRILPRVVKAIN